MIQIHCNSVEVKEFVPKGILYPAGSVYYNLKCTPPFVTFTYKTANDLVKTEDGQVLVQVSTLNRKLNYDADVDDDKIYRQKLIGIRIAQKIDRHTAFGSTIRRCCGDDGEALWKIKFDDEFLADDVEVSEVELKPLQLLYTKE